MQLKASLPLSLDFSHLAPLPEICLHLFLAYHKHIHIYPFVSTLTVLQLTLWPHYIALRYFHIGT